MNKIPSFIDVTASDGHVLSAWCAGPPAATRSLVVVQEIFGVNHYIRSVCHKLADLGYCVVAPALFDRVSRGYERGYSREEAQEGMAIRHQLDETLALDDILAAAALLPGRKGIIGFCMGGTLCWQAASRSTAFDAAVGWYGTGIAADLDARLNCPVQLHYGDKDHAIPLEDALKVRDARPDVAVFIYDAGHGFGCTERASHVEPAATLAWQRSLAFFDRHLDRKPPAGSDR